MAAAIPIRIQYSEQGVRPLDVRRDLAAVVKLLELGFGAELDPPGLRTLARLQRVARRSWWAQLWGADTIELPGLVWVDDGAIVANLSLRRAAAGRGGWLIGNVVVHPQQRRRGIGRALMEAALETAQERGARWVGLEVRADNTAAHTLYAQLGFQPVGETVHLLRPAARSWPAPPPTSILWRTHRSGDEQAWYKLAQQVYPRPLCDLLELRPAEYAYGGWERTVQLWFEGRRERAWLEGISRPRLALAVQTDRRCSFHVWELLAHPEASAAGIAGIAAQALNAMRQQPVWPTTAIVASQPHLVEALLGLDFELHRTLLQMKLDLTR